MLTLISTLLLASTALALPFSLRFPAREASGFSLVEGVIRPVKTCAFERGEEFSAISLRLVSDEAAGIRLQVTETLELPLQEGVIPTYQTGLEAVYENGVLEFQKRFQSGLTEEHLLLRLKIDPLLQKLEEAEARLWRKDELIRLPMTEIQRLSCRF